MSEALLHNFIIANVLVEDNILFVFKAFFD